MERYWMICDKVVDLRVEICKNLRRGWDKRRLVAVAASQVLWGNDRNSISGLGFHQQNLAMIVGKISALNNLGDERPEFECLVGRLVVEHKVYAWHFFILSDKKRVGAEILRR